MSMHVVMVQYCMLHVLQHILCLLEDSLVRIESYFRRSKIHPSGDATRKIITSNTKIIIIIIKIDFSLTDVALLVP